MRVTVVSPHPIYPATSGDRLRTTHLLQALPAAGVEAELVAWRWNGQPPVAPWAARYADGKPSSFLARARWRTALAIERRKDPFAIVTRRDARSALRSVLEAQPAEVTDFQHSFSYLVGFPSAICTFHNVESMVLRRAGAPARQIQTTESLEDEVLNDACGVVAFSEEDKALLDARGSHAEIRCVPLGVNPPGGQVREAQADGLATALFVGSFEYAPNVEAAEWLIGAWPKLRAAGLKRLLIVGRQARRLGALPPGVEIYADVPSLAPFLMEADLLLVPLATGGGVRVKIIEALAAALPVLTTPIGAEGLGLICGVEACVAERVEFVDALVSLRPREVRESLAQSGRLVWQQRHSPARMAKEMASLYRDVSGVA